MRASSPDPRGFESLFRSSCKKVTTTTGSLTKEAQNDRYISIGDDSHRIYRIRSVPRLLGGIFHHNGERDQQPEQLHRYNEEDQEDRDETSEFKRILDREMERLNEK